VMLPALCRVLALSRRYLRSIDGMRPGGVARYRHFAQCGNKVIRAVSRGGTIDTGPGGWCMVTG
jgi:hypothetical protein